MKQKIITLLCILMAGSAFSQKYLTKSGTVHFEANVPLFEDVDAKHGSTVAVLNSDSGDLAVISTVKDFRFKVALMEEHFNENYAESAKFPKTTFVGKILNFNKEDLSATPKSYTISGVHHFHGADRNVTSVASIFTKDGKIIISGKFIARPADYQVKIPKMVMRKIAEQVNVDYQFELAKQ
ncbi:MULTISPECIES: YceI family protein [Chryseobacterium]|uniref:YceI family protein n=1 Tax=Chryseobacterium sp. R2A-55 TaxID=2744445 RepID=UPI001F37382E|nr:YceI family protein [Chryseobacterium sp. R2A-55]